MSVFFLATCQDQANDGQQCGVDKIVNVANINTVSTAVNYPTQCCKSPINCGEFVTFGKTCAGDFKNKPNPTDVATTATTDAEFNAKCCDQCNQS